LRDSATSSRTLESDAERAERLRQDREWHNFQLTQETGEEKSDRQIRNAEGHAKSRRERSPEGVRSDNRQEAQRIAANRYERTQQRPATHGSFCKHTLDTIAEDNSPERHELQWMNTLCPQCGSVNWTEERVDYRSEVQRRARTVNKFALCCNQGKFCVLPVRPPPTELCNLYEEKDNDSKYFYRHIRLINSNLAFASMLANKADLPGGRGPPIIRMQGAIHHVMGSLLPEEEKRAKFMSIYIYDSAMELANRLHYSNDDAAMKRILSALQAMLHNCSPLVATFKSALEQIQGHPDETHLRLVLSSRCRPVEAHKRTYNTPTANEIGAVLPIRDENDRKNLAPQSIVLALRSGALEYIAATHPLNDALHYVLFRPFGDYGWSPKDRLEQKMSLRGYCAHQLMYRPPGTKCVHFPGPITPEYYPTLHYGRRLFQQYIVDQAARLIDERLTYVFHNQEKIRADLYQGISDALSAKDLQNVGRRVVLPSSFTGSRRAQEQHYQDGLAIVLNQGKPTGFITFTCNPGWVEITRELLPHQQASDRPDLVARVFRMKFQQLIHELLHKNIFGKVTGYTAVIEFQKRGLPHAHILIILCDEDTPKTADLYDRYVSAEIPSLEHPKLRKLVLKHMIHGPCGARNRKSPCMIDRKCSKHYPKSFALETTDDDDSYPEYRRRPAEKGGETAMLYEDSPNPWKVDNSWVVPYNPELLLRFEGHINFEIVTSLGVMKYLFKYIHKGDDMITMGIQAEQKERKAPDVVAEEKEQKAPDGDEPSVVNEIEMYRNARYISPCEGVWQILRFPMQEHAPHVERLEVHLQNMQYVAVNTVSERVAADILKHHESTMLTDWFRLNIEEEPASLTEKQLAMGPPCRELRYIDLPRLYTWSPKTRRWKRRANQAKWPAIGRMYNCHPKEGERYYLRRLLHYVKGARSFDQLLCYNGEDFQSEACETLQAVCARMGLLQDDREWEACLKEAAHYQAPQRLRRLFNTILVHCQPQAPLQLWEKFQEALCSDILFSWRKSKGDFTLQLNDAMIGECLHQLNGMMMESSNKSITTFGLPLPAVIDDTSAAMMHEVRAALCYDKAALKKAMQEAYAKMADEQKFVYDTVMQSVSAKEDAQENKHAGDEKDASNAQDHRTAHFLEAPGGTGKTFTVNAIIDAVRAQGKIVIPVASSGLAALLLPDGRTAHSRFKIPLAVNHESKCYINKRNDAVGNLMKHAHLIVWDEAPMQQRFVFEAVDRTLRDLKDSDQIFGNIPVLFCGDFQQILPVTPRGSRQQIIAKCLKQSPLWKEINVMQLTENQRIRHRLGDDAQAQKARLFNEYLQRLGHGTEPVYEARGADVVLIPKELVSSAKDLSEFLVELYPELASKFGDAAYFGARAILTTKNATVDVINEKMLQLYPGEESLPYLSADELADRDDPLEIPTELLNALTPSGLPPHKLRLKLQAPIILLRNLDPSIGACNGTSLFVKELSKTVITGQIMLGKHAGELVYIPRVKMSPSEGKFSFTMSRLQFPVRLAFAMTINKSQGQTFTKVGIYLPQPVFTHGQLYVAVSRVGSPDDISVFIENRSKKKKTAAAKQKKTRSKRKKDEEINPAHCMNTAEGTFTSNIVFREIFSDAGS